MNSVGPYDLSASWYCFDNPLFTSAMVEIITGTIKNIASGIHVVPHQSLNQARLSEGHQFVATQLMR